MSATPSTTSNSGVTDKHEPSFTVSAYEFLPFTLPFGDPCSDSPSLATSSSFPSTIQYCEMLTGNSTTAASATLTDPPPASTPKTSDSFRKVSIPVPLQPLIPTRPFLFPQNSQIGSPAPPRRHPCSDLHFCRRFRKAA
ncbi:hypothetical protein Rs2_29246 [Raphanus sativus]|nr:hypothetical protein Rs2_29246 [Raphanus sativus]